MISWASSTYEQGVSCLSGYSAAEITLAKTVLKDQDLTYKKMNGNSVCGLKGDKISSDLPGVNMTEVFSDLLNNGNLTPASYVLNILRACNKANYSGSQLIKIVGRSLVSFASFLREIDFADVIQNKITGSICTRATAAGDKLEHTDILLNYMNEEFRIWTYTCTNNDALNHTAEKLLGIRGALPDGTIILCPLDLSDRSLYITHEGWFLYSDFYAKKIQWVIDNADRSAYSAVKKNDKQHIVDYVKKMHIINV